MDLPTKFNDFQYQINYKLNAKKKRYLYFLELRIQTIHC